MPSALSELIVFDFDGTLADTVGDIATALNRTLHDVGLPAAAEVDVRRWIGDGVRRLVERAVPEAMRSADRIAALAVDFGIHYARCCVDTTVLYPGIAECLTALSGYPLAILSNKPTPFLVSIADGLGIRDRFAAIVGGDALPVTKPDPAVLRHLVAAIGSQPDAIWMIGDSAIDIATGRAAAARTIGCAWGLRGAAELREAQAEFVVEFPTEIPPLIRQR